MDVSIIPANFPRGGEILAELRRACSELDLSERVASIAVTLDAPEFEGAALWQLEPHDETRVDARLYGSPLDVLSPVARERRDAHVLDEERLSELPRERVDRIRADRWIYRNVLQLDDLLAGRIEPGSIPRESSTAFQACWDVWTDGRLKNRSMPGISQAERRGAFFRTFARGALLLPRHWNVFHRLWEEKLAGQDGILEALQQLPRPI